ncbi:MAG: hypothetical protein GZ085_07830 [Sulfuriferula multivorans]|uniref:Uncharacterized protein n=1 Tax=Sulfuriferula multivorans TaxID=1559896 RepID=A0A7C9P5F5_9PROT|nr:hypothetical protein [Sulfuriferula multivorans]
MKLKKFALGALVVLAAGGVGGWLSLDKETRGLLAAMPTNRDLLFWLQFLFRSHRGYWPARQYRKWHRSSRPESPAVSLLWGCPVFDPQN